MTIIVVTPPGPVVSWAEAKAHLRLDSDDEKGYVDTLVAAAQGLIEGPAGWLGRTIGAQVLESRFDSFGCDLDLMPTDPKVTTVSYVGADGQEAVLADTAYRLGGSPTRPRVRLARGQVWPAIDDDEDSVRIRYSSGFSLAPAPIKQAILLFVGQWFEHRENAANAKIETMPMASEALLLQFRVYR